VSKFAAASGKMPWDKYHAYRRLLCDGGAQDNFAAARGHAHRHVLRDAVHLASAGGSRRGASGRLRSTPSCASSCRRASVRAGVRSSE